MTQKKRKKQDLKRFDGRKDELDPRFIFNGTYTQLLTEALKGDFDVNYLIRRELANRGFDGEGKWIGFKQAKELHKIEKE